MILFAPNPTGSGHNMRALSIAQAIKKQRPDMPLTVALASLQPTFTPMFEKSGVEVVDIAGRLVDYSKKSNLSKELDWNNYIGGYIANTFLSGERILSYLALIAEYKPTALVSDYNMAACLAAIFSGTPLVFVTELLAPGRAIERTRSRYQPNSCPPSSAGESRTSSRGSTRSLW